MYLVISLSFSMYRHTYTCINIQTLSNTQLPLSLPVYLPLYVGVREEGKEKDS